MLVQYACHIWFLVGCDVDVYEKKGLKMVVELRCTNTRRVFKVALWQTGKRAWGSATACQRLRDPTKQTCIYI